MDALELGDTLVEIGGAARRGEVTAKGRLDDFLAAAGRPLTGADDVGVMVRWHDGAEEPYAHAVHDVGPDEARAMAAESGLPELLVLGIVRVALAPA